MKYIATILVFAALQACSNSRHITIPAPAAPGDRLTGSLFYKTVAGWNWKQRDSLAAREILSGNMPSFLRKFVAVTSRMTDSTGTEHRAVLYVSPDYLSIGTDDDWARIPLTPMSAQKIADRFQCFLSTRKIVDLVYEQARVKPEPVPMFAFRDSSVTLWQHHLIIEGQRKGKNGLIAGIKKDVVQSGMNTAKADRVAIYGWHRTDGKPIQPLYSGHINWYVDYSHGIRLVYNQVWVDGKKMNYEDVLQHPVYFKLLCDEPLCKPYRYPY